MNYTDAITGKNIVKKYKNFTLNQPQLHIPKGFTTALVGENGAGKSTLLNILSGVRLDYEGDITYFEGSESMKTEQVKERIGFTAPNDYFFSNWTIEQICQMYDVLYDNFHVQRFKDLIRELEIPVAFGREKTKRRGLFDRRKGSKQVNQLSDGNRIKLQLAGVLARDTDLLIMDEPASPLDPLMRDVLCDKIRSHMEEGDGERSVLLSTHNITDMENVTDYVCIMEQGSIIEQGFVPDLKEKYILVKGDAEQIPAVSGRLFDMTKNSYGFEGILLADHSEEVAGLGLSMETPSLSQICVAVMRNYRKSR